MNDNATIRRRHTACAFGTFVAAGAVSVALLGLTGAAQAAGFTLKEQSAAALGNAFAGATAGAEDVTYMYFNPAGLALQSDNQVAAVANYIMVQGETDNAVGAPGEAGSGDAAEDALVPAAYGMWSISPDLKIGVGVNAPFGLSTKYTTTWAGRFDAVESAIQAINVNPAVAYRLTPELSVGVGLQIQSFDVTLSNMAGLPGLAEVNGDDWGFGATAGLLYEFSSDTRVGIGYRSQVAHTLEGDLTFSAVPGTVVPISADFTSPDSVSAGAYHAYNDKLAVMADIVWTRWSSFDELRITRDVDGVTVALTPEDWEDVWAIALGATYTLSETVSLRGGLAYDQSPIPDNRRTPRLTDEDRIWTSIGAQFRPSPAVTIDAGYAHLFIKDSSVNLPDRTGVGGPPALTADYQNSADILSIQAVFHF